MFTFIYFHFNMSYNMFDISFINYFGHEMSPS